MSKRTPAGSALVPLAFGFLAVAAALVALPRPVTQPASPLPAPGDPSFEEQTFHLPVKVPSYPGGGSFCEECHSLPPHEGSGVSPAFSNDHSSFMDCLVCHWAKRSGESPEAYWHKSEGGEMFLGLSPQEDKALDRKALREGLLAGQACFDRGRSCHDCHKSGGMDPYVRPGLSEQGQAALENLPDFFTLTKGTKWYFPQRQ